MIEQCPACGELRYSVAASLDARRRDRYREFSRVKYDGVLESRLGDIEPEILRCEACGHCWYRTQPSADQLAVMYSSALKLGGEAPTLAPTPHMVREMRRLRALLPAGSSPPTLLDFGAGAGRWSRAAVQAGFRVFAFEPSVTRSRDSDDFESVHDLEALAGRRFSAVQLEQVLEHVHDPVATLQVVRDLCAERAIVRITVPNILRAPEGDALWKTWPFDGNAPHTLAPFEHLHGFTPASLDAALRSAGMRRLGGAGYLRAYAMNGLRQTLGKVLPKLGSTLRLVTPG